MIYHKRTEIHRIRIAEQPNKRKTITVYTPEPLVFTDVDQLSLVSKGLKKQFSKELFLDEEVIDFYEPTKAYLELLESKELGKRRLLVEIVE